MQKYITTPIYYLNGSPHIGHAYTSILGDVLKKFEAMKGNDVFYTTGTDEHGQKNQHSCEQSGLPVEEFTKQQSDKFRNLFVDLGIDFDYFVRTSLPEHKEIVKKVLTLIYDKGLIVKKSYEGLYCEGCEQFKKKTDLDEHGLCPDHKVAPKVVTEENYFFRLEPYRQWLIDYIKHHPDWIQPAKYAKEVLGMLNEPLDDLCISRPKNRVWLGVELPFDKDYVTYIWFDALVNYISSIGFGQNPGFDGLWDNSHHLMAKDIIKPHCIYWPIMLNALGLHPAKHCFIHGYWIGEGGVKMSKSLGNVVDPVEVSGIIGKDALRFYLINNMTLNADSQISIDLLKQGYRQLANNIGNLQMRVLKMVDKNLGGLVPEAAPDKDGQELLNGISSAFRKLYKRDMSLEVISELSSEIIKSGDAVNAYFAAQTPWVLAKDPAQADAFKAVIYTTLEALRLIAVAASPIMPDISAKILASLGIEESCPSVAGLENLRLKPGSRIKVGDPLFPFIE